MRNYMSFRLKHRGDYNIICQFLKVTTYCLSATLHTTSHWASKLHLNLLLYLYRGRDVAVGIPTRYGLGSNPGGGRDFPHPPSLLYNEYKPLLGVKRPGRGLGHPPLSNAEVEGRVELYICSSSGPSWPILGRTLPLPLLYLYTVYFGRTQREVEARLPESLKVHGGEWLVSRFDRFICEKSPSYVG